jgi:hypothetical protein
MAEILACAVSQNLVLLKKIRKIKNFHKYQGFLQMPWNFRKCLGTSGIARFPQFPATHIKVHKTRKCIFYYHQTLDILILKSFNFFSLKNQHLNATMAMAQLLSASQSGSPDAGS